MNFKKSLIVIAAALFLGFTAVAAFQAFGILGVILLILATIMVAISVIINFRSRVKLIDEMEIGVIFNRFNHNFCRFKVSPDPTPMQQNQNQASSNWLPFGSRLFIYNDPYYEPLKWYEELKSTIPKKAQTAKGTLANIRTAEGVQISIDWKVSYDIDVTLIKPEKIKHKMARALPEHSQKMVTGKVTRAIKHLVEMRPIESLYAQGAIQQLEEEVATKTSEQLSGDTVNLGFKKIPVKDVSLGPIEMPAKVEKALELAHQRKIQTEMVAGALGKLKQAVNDFSKEDIRRWAELERLRILDDKEADLFYMSDAFVRSESTKVKQQINGRSQKKS
ncbi:MAG: hypothetical protein GY805_30635 [Chloroflexi bacterium]|nr:hypothetical protein [Chloroflexota bacterium]